MIGTVKSLSPCHIKIFFLIFFNLKPQSLEYKHISLWTPVVPRFTASLKFSINFFPLSIVKSFKSSLGRGILFYNLLKPFLMLQFNKYVLNILSINQDKKGLLP